MKLLPNKLQRTLSRSCGLHSFDFGFVPFKFLRYHGIGGLSEYKPNSKSVQSLLSFRMLLSIKENFQTQHKENHEYRKEKNSAQVETLKTE
jgi:hypothetical protein